MKIAILLAAASFALAVNATAQLSINRSVIAGGGGASASPVYSLHGTIGQPTVGILSSSKYVFHGGFWPTVLTPPPWPCPVAGSLTIKADEFGVLLRWCGHGWILQSTTDLVTWTDSTLPVSSSGIRYTARDVVKEGGIKFYRLRWP